VSAASTVAVGVGGDDGWGSLPGLADFVVEATPVDVDGELAPVDVDGELAPVDVLDVLDVRDVLDVVAEAELDDDRCVVDPLDPPPQPAIAAAAARASRAL